MRELQDKSKLHDDHMSIHKINGVYRAKMVDWIMEVLTAFKCED
jgi:hypothetical protein